MIDKLVWQEVGQRERKDKDKDKKLIYSKLFPFTKRLMARSKKKLVALFPKCHNIQVSHKA